MSCAAGAAGWRSSTWATSSSRSSASAEPVAAGHYGLVVDDQDEVVRRARDAGARMIGGHDFLDPWGNHWQVVDYRDVQFTKTERVLEGWASASSGSPSGARRAAREGSRD